MKKQIFDVENFNMHAMNILNFISLLKIVEKWRPLNITDYLTIYYKNKLSTELAL